MNEQLSRPELASRRAALQDRLAVMIKEIRSNLETGKNQEYTEVSEQVRDLGDAATADVLIDARIFDIQRDVEELKDIRKALRRMEEGSYGWCIDCGEPIALARLRAQPAAARCLPCQSRHEREYGAPDSPRRI